MSTELIEDLEDDNEVSVGLEMNAWTHAWLCLGSDNDWVRFHLTPDAAGIAAAKRIEDALRIWRHKAQKPCPKHIEGLIRWRDSQSLDWCGEELVFHILATLTEYHKQFVPDEHMAAFREWLTLDEDLQTDYVEQVLSLIEKEAQRPSP